MQTHSDDLDHLEDIDLTPEEIEEIVAESARRRELLGPDLSPRAAKVWHDAENDWIMVQLTNGCVFGFPRHEGQGLENATPEQLANGEVLDDGYGIGWEELDAHIAVPGIIFDLLNIRGWYARWLGSATSEAKAAAARENGKKGGRPRTRAQAPKRSGRNRATGGD